MIEGTQQPKKRGRKPKEKNNYFGEREEQAVLEYISTDDPEVKNDLYNDVLSPALCKMSESIIRRYNLYLPDECSGETFNDTISFLEVKMKKFNSGKISKKTGKKVRAYSYYQTVVKNYLIGRIKKYNKNLLRYPSYETVSEDVSNSIRYIDETSRGSDIAKELVDKVLDKSREILDEGNALKDNERKMGKALVNLLENWDYVLSTDGSNKLNKNAILFFLREQTGMDTKGVRDSLKKYKKLYADLKKKVVEAN